MAGPSLIDELEALGESYVVELAPLTGEPEIRGAQARFLRKLSEQMKRMRELPAEARPRVGEVANRIKRLIEEETEKRLIALKNRARQRDLERTIDVTLPGRAPPAGHLHILTQVRRELVAIFAELGFEVATGPQIDTDFNNFEALAMPPDHPARDAQDTFYIEGDGKVLLRTHTSTVQIRTMLARKPPIRVIAPGTVYRRDDDATHSPMFNQLEMLVVDEGIRFSDLKGVLLHLIHRLFGPGLTVRFRSSYFPFVEPGAEVDMQCAFCRGKPGGCRLCKGTGWIELGGSGMVVPSFGGV